MSASPAEAIAAINFSLIQPLSTAANFFHAYPRIGNAPTDFSTTDAYRAGLYRLGLPYFILGAIFLLFPLVLNLFAYVRRGVVPGADDSADSDPDNRDNIGKAFLLFSAFLNLSIIACIGLALASAFSMQKAATNAHQSVDATAVQISSQLFDNVKFVSELAQISRKGGFPSDTETTDTIKLLDSHSSGFASVINATQSIYNHFDVINDDIRKISSDFFKFTVVVLLLSLFAILLSVFADASNPDATYTRISVLLILLLALTGCWSLTAVTTWVGVGSGDFCHSVNDFHQVLVGQRSHGHAYRSSVYANNIFLSNDLQCPRFSSAGPSLRRLNIFLGSARISDWFLRGLNTITGFSEPLEQWRDTILGIQDTLAIYVECDVQQRLGGHLATHICGSNGIGAISAIFQLWLYSIALSLLVTLVVILLTLGHPPSEFCSCRELLYIYGAPKLLPVFGDVQRVLSKHSTFRNLQSKKLSFLDGAMSDSEDSQATRFGDQDCLSENDNSISTQRSRRNAYTSHKLKTPVNRHTVWSSDSDDPNTNSDGLP